MYQAISPFSIVFSRDFYSRHVKTTAIWERVRREKDYLFTIQYQLLMMPRKNPLENILEKGKNADNQYFLPFSSIFSHDLVVVSSIPS